MSLRTLTTLGLEVSLGHSTHFNRRVVYQSWNKFQWVEYPDQGLRYKCQELGTTKIKECKYPQAIKGIEMSRRMVTGSPVRDVPDTFLTTSESEGTSDLVYFDPTRGMT